MNALKLIEDYQARLRHYSPEQLSYKSGSEVWSLGQMYQHLIDVALEYLEHVATCAATQAVQPLGKTEAGAYVYKHGQFPPIKIKLPDELNRPSNLESNDTLAARLKQVKHLMLEWQAQLETIRPTAKVKHDGFGWLNAREWYALIGMHFQHHLRQKEELEQLLPRANQNNF